MQRANAMMGGILALMAVVCAGAALGQPLSPPNAGDLLARPAIASPQISPDGQRLVFLRHAQPGEPEGVAVVVLGIGEDAFETLSYINLEDKKVSWVSWANNDRLLISFELVTPVEGAGVIMINEEGERFLFRELTRRQIVAMDLDGSNPTPMIDFDDRKFNSTSNLNLDRIIDYLPDDPDHVLIPARSGRFANLNVYRVNVYTGDAERIARGSPRTVAWFTNGRGEAVMRWDLTSSYRTARVMVRSGEGSRWRTVVRTPIHEFGRLNEDYTWVARGERYDEALVFARSPQTGTTGLYRYSFTDAALAEPVFLNPDYDVADVLADPLTGRLSALRWADTHNHVEVLDPEIAAHMDSLASFFGQDVTVAPIQRAGEVLLLNVSGPQEPDSYYLYDMAQFAVQPLGASLPALFERALAGVEVYEYTARDGQSLFGYLTLPEAPASTPPPLVVMPHGGPERRDFYGFDLLAQLVAAEGFAVFQPQFRGSSGFGQAFAEAGYGEMGGLIQNDITDGVRALAASGRVDPDQMCVAGWSFGGYSALMQPILNPGLYRCAFAAAPVTHLEQMADWHRQFAEEDDQALAYVERMLGYPDTARMQQASPALRASEVDVPVLLVHGRRDTVVPFEQSEVMLEALEAAGADVALVPFAGGHSPDLDAELVTVTFHMGRFLAEHLGEDAEPEETHTPDPH